MRQKRKQEVRKYAEGTKVSVERSRAELETILDKHKASEVGIFRNADKHIVIYRMHGRMVRQVVLYPVPSQLPGVRSDQMRQQQENEFMRRWRALVLITKAKLEMVTSGERTFEQEFLADIMLPDNTTVGEMLKPKLIEAYASATMPKMPMLGSGIK